MKKLQVIPLMRVALCIPALCLFLSSCSDRPNEVDLTILYTTDVHGMVLPYDFALNEPAAHSLANVSNYVKQVRTENPEGTILLDAGDCCSGQPSSYYYNYVDVYSEHVVPSVYNYMGYDAVGIGASDIELGPKIYRERLPEQFKMPILCANLVDERTGQPIFKPYTVIDRQGVKIAILGMTRPDIDAWIPRQLFEGLRLEDLVACGQKWVKIIQEKENPDLIIGLFHSGSGLHGWTGNAEFANDRNGNASIETAQKSGGICLVLMGHDHRSYEGQFKADDGTTFSALQSAPRCAELGRADLKLKLMANGRYDVQVQTQIVSMKGQPIDEEMNTKFAEVTPRINDYLDHPLGDVSDTLRAIDAVMGPSTMMDLIHNMQLWTSSAQVSITNFSAIRDIPSGRITTRDLFSIYQYNNQLYTLKMTGEELDRFLEYGYACQYNVMTAGTDHLLRFMYDDHGFVKKGDFGPELYTAHYRYSSAAGIRYVVDVRKPYDDRVEILSMSDGKPFRKSDTLIVAINSHQVAGGGRYFSKGLGWNPAMVQSRIVTSDVTDLRMAFANYIRLNYMIKPALRGDWKVVPEDWFNKAKVNDIKFLGKRFNFSVDQ